MERVPWFFDPEVLVLTQVAGMAVFLMALIVTVLRRRLVPATTDGKVASFRR